MIWGLWGRLIASLAMGFASFVGTVVFEVMFLVGKLLPLDPPEYPAQDGIERVPTVTFVIALVVALLVASASWLVHQRVANRRSKAR